MTPPTPPNKEEVERAKAHLVHLASWNADIWSGAKDIRTILSALASAESRLEIAERERDEARRDTARLDYYDSISHTGMKFRDVLDASMSTRPTSTSTDREVGSMGDKDLEGRRSYYAADDPGYAPLWGGQSLSKPPTVPDNPTPETAQRPMMSSADLRRLVRSVPGLNPHTCDGMAMLNTADALDSLREAVKGMDARTGWDFVMIPAKQFEPLAKAINRLLGTTESGGVDG